MQQLLHQLCRSRIPGLNTLRAGSRAIGRSRCQASLSAAATAGPLPGEVVVICGASKGIGLEVARQCLAAGALVAAIGRTAETSSGLATLAESPQGASRLLRISCDATDEEQLEGAAAAVRGRFGRADAVLSSVGMLSDPTGQVSVRQMPERSLQQVTAEQLLMNFKLNALAPALTAKHFMPLLLHAQRQAGAQQGVFASLSARVGSIGDNKKGGWYSYRASKAAQNQLLRTLAHETNRSRVGPIVLMLHPGTVDTDLSKPFHGVVTWELFPVERAASQLLDIIFRATPADNGKFLDWKGEEIPW
ncbi:unnamed protein product [Polarella glacialis]|uniref:C-factor n=1 Tax=Polarella glacialis TaxID=89957 RepID=A0A813J0T7_POLGL|nr:unnamed protein product [Polarella glacialis]CAE8702495.1 unnamed protein product [Polarella glacialis]